ncbi:MAG: CBS domain-containing protein [Planctomycetota bacterium]|nr:CBS domain-containing protein [Planctomycetota bacterium]
MGQQDVSNVRDQRALQAFTKALLEDVHALELLLEGDLIESGVSRIGAEQEMFLIHDRMRPALVAPQILDDLKHDRLASELAQFNLEANLHPVSFGGDCLGRMEKDLNDMLAVARQGAAKHNAEVLLCGILPTLRKGDLGIESMSPSPRYHELNRALTQLRGGDFQIRIKGLEELNMSHDNVMFEACNTSFQIHFQIDPKDALRRYNIAQAITGPVLAAAVNSPLLLGKRLWQETRIALFEGSLDTRSDVHLQREQQPRVQFGDAWVRESVMEIFREEIARFRVVIAADWEKDPVSIVRKGGVPQLSALRLHNGTVYRWNRLCYGVSEEGVPHLRIENRALPAGPTVVDQMANAAFFFGLMSAYIKDCPHFERRLRFEDARLNFFAAARYGLGAQFTWLDGKTYTAPKLILDELLPKAMEGLKVAGIDKDDSQRYLDIIAQRVRSGQTGSTWALQSLRSMSRSVIGKQDAHIPALTAALMEQQTSGHPVHTWPLASGKSDESRMREGFRTVGQIMSKDIFTVRPEDIIDLAANVMDWKHVRHVPVENNEGELIGIVSHRALLRVVARGLSHDRESPMTVQEIMRTDPVTAAPETPTIDVIRLMKENKVSCLPIVDGGQLVGIVTERDLNDIAASLLERILESS